MKTIVYIVYHIYKKDRFDKGDDDCAGRETGRAN